MQAIDDGLLSGEDLSPQGADGTFLDNQMQPLQNTRADIPHDETDMGDNDTWITPPNHNERAMAHRNAPQDPQRALDARRSLLMGATIV